MRTKTLPLLLLWLAAGCSNGHPCTAKVHCTLEAGEAACEPGYVWLDETSTNDFRCVEGDGSTGQTGSNCGGQPACTAQGASRCDGAVAQTCQPIAEDCLGWLEVATCTAPQVCAQGACAAECVDACVSPGAVRCDGDAAILSCRDSNGDGCLEWVDRIACEAGQTCSNGSCAVGCSDECTAVGARSCEASGTKICGNHDADTCLEWSDVVACGSGTTCSNGYCSVDCTDECGAIAEAICDGAAVRTCGLFDADPCLDLSDPSACPTGSSCNAGQCVATCTDSCSAGATRCSGNGVQSCEELGGCLQWGTIVPCPSQESCVADVCTSSPPPATVVISELLYDAAGSDDDTFIELHGPPGTPLAGFNLAGINGNGGVLYSLLDLQGSIGASGLFLVVNDSASSSLRGMADLVSSTVDYQNGPDSVQLRWGDSVVDSVGYGSFASAVFAGEGNAAVDVDAGSSLARDASYTDTDDNASDFAALTLPTPGAPNLDDNLQPVAGLACPSVGLAGELLTFDASASADADGTLVGYAFSFGDGTSASGQPVVQHAYASAGSYQVSLTVTDDGGATDSEYCTVTIGADPCASVTCGNPPAAACVDSSTLREHSPNGSCSAGLCSYSHADTPCPHGCLAGACLPGDCSGIACDTPPADTCIDATHLEAWAPLGICDASQNCAYQANEIECSEGCFGGACIAGSWQLETPALADPSYHDMDLTQDALGRLHIAYCRSNPLDLVYRTRDDYGWREEVVDPGVAASGCQVAIALDANGHPMIAYRDATNADLRFARRINDQFELQLVANAGAVGEAPSVALRADGVPLVAFLDASNNELRLATSTTGGWQIETVAEWHGGATPLTRMAHDAQERLHIIAGPSRSLAVSSGNYSQPDVYLHVREPGGWQSSLLLEDGMLSRDSLRFAPNGETLVLLGEVAQTGTSDRYRYLRVDGGVVLSNEIIRHVTNLNYDKPRGLLHTDALPTMVRDNGTRYELDEHGYWHQLAYAFGGTYGAAIVDVEWQAGRRALFVHSGLHIATEAACVADCSGRTCGADGCGGICGTCSAGTYCDPVGQCGAWQYETLSDFYGDYGVLVEGDDTLHGFGDGLYVRLAHSSNESGAWQSEDIALTPDRSFSFSELGAQIDAGGSAHIVGIEHRPTYYNAWDKLVAYHETPSGWQGEELGQLFFGSEAPALLIDAAGVWHLAYNDRSYPDSNIRRLIYATFDSGAFTSEVLAAPEDDYGRGGGWASDVRLALDGAGRVHIWWMQSLDYTGQVSLRHTTNASGAWVEAVLEEPYGRHSTYLAADSAGDVHGVYKENSGDWVYRRLDQGTWSSEALPVTYFDTFLLDPMDRAVVVDHGISTPGITFHTRQSAGTWTTDSLPVLSSGSVSHVRYGNAGTMHVIYSGTGGATQSLTRHAWR